MTPNDLERECQAWLDARRPLPPDDDPVWTPFLATDAETTFATLGRYRRLQDAIARWVAAPEYEASKAWLEILVRAGRPIRRRWHPTRWAIAASSLIGLIGLRSAWHESPTEPKSPTVAVRPLNRTLSEASEATLQLARATGEPAARLGRSVFEKAEWTTSPLLPEISMEGASDTLIGVSQRFGQGVRPLGGSARKAFGFLLAPVSADPPMPAKPTPAERIL